MLALRKLGMLRHQAKEPFLQLSHATATGCLIKLFLYSFVINKA